MTLNPNSEVHKCALPVITDRFACLDVGESFITPHLSDAYNQLRLDYESRKLTLINTHRGLFCYNLLPFVISSARAIFQRKIDSVFQGLPVGLAYLDGVILSAKNADDKTKLRCIFPRFRKHGVRLRYYKCRF